MSVFRQLMMKQDNKEVFTNILNYNSTMVLYHFDNNNNKEGYMASDFRLIDGSYRYNSDYKFGTKSVENYHYSMTSYSYQAYSQHIDLGCYDKTLEMWIKPVNQSYSCSFGLSNGNWSDQRYVSLTYNGNHFYGPSGSTPVDFIDNKLDYNEWNHVALTYAKVDNVLVLTLWVNGEYCSTAQFALMTFVERFFFNVCNSDTSVNYALVDEVVFHNYIRYTRPFMLQTEAYVVEQS